MGSIRNALLVIVILVTATLLCAAGVAVASDVTYAIAGVETGFTTDSSSFAGTAVAPDDVAFWNALVERTPFDADRNATITGGTFRLDGRVRDLQGVILPNGTITNLKSNCRREVFAIEGDIALTAPAGGTGHFAATLTHYLARVNGECVIFFATVDGSVTFSLP